MVSRNRARERLVADGLSPDADHPSVLLGGALTYHTGSASLRLQGRYGLGRTCIDKVSDVQFPNLKHRAFLFTTGPAMAVGS